MVFFLFRQEELREIFGRLGYDYRADTLTRNVAYYDRRTPHGSTLSVVTHAGVLAAVDPESSWHWFLVALHSDADDIQGGARVYHGVLHFNPPAPEQARQPVVLYAVPRVPDPGDTHRRSPDAGRPPRGGEPTRQVAVRDDARELRPGDQTVFELSRNPATTGPSARD